MSTSLHTPGPWAIVASGKGTNWVCGGSGFRKRVAKIVERNIHTDEDGRIPAANARLIAAAPEMLDALKKCQAFLVSIARTDFGGVDELHAVNAAIARTEGRS